MSNPTRQHLIGYLLGAIESDEQTVVEQQLQHDEMLRRELELLRGSIHPLAVDHGHHEPPAGLAQRCCEYVYSRTEIMPAALSPVVENPAAASRSRRWSWLDLTVAGAIAVAVAVLLVPAIYQSRGYARLVACQSNLKDIGTAVSKYSDLHGGSYPIAPAGDRFNVAGMWAPTLISQGYLNEPDRTVVCPSSALADDLKFRVPTMKELEAMSPAQLVEIYPRLAGYGFTLGYIDADKGAYQAHHNQHRQNFAVAADPPGSGPSNSPNHGGDGQNVLFEDGHYKYLNSPRVNDDDIFQNARNEVAPGVHANDAVIVPSQIRP